MDNRITPFEPDTAWPEPEPLSNALLPVPAFDPDMLPEALRAWVIDIADRMQCPPDFPAVAAMTALSGVIGRRVGIRPKTRDDWLEVANLWGLVIGRPGAMKSPAMGQALGPLRRLDVRAGEANQETSKAYARAKLAYEAKKKQADKNAATRLKSDPDADVSALYPDPPPIPPMRRFIMNDTTYEALGVAVADNPMGLLVERDEIMGLLTQLRNEERAADRAFYLSAWNGTGAYKFNRITRGEVILPAVCLSLLGGTQPGKIGAFVRDANSGGLQDDGLLQRFGMMVWPDQTGEWHPVDRYPNAAAKGQANRLFEHLAVLDPLALGAEQGEFDTIPALRFDPDAQAIFNDWHASHEALLRRADLPPALESHLSKHRKLVPSLALICHLADDDGSASGAIGKGSILRAIAWADYLRLHAERVYGAGSKPEKDGARMIWEKVKRGQLPARFTTRDVYRREWQGLKDRDAARTALAVLAEHGLVVAHRETDTGGAPSEVWFVNPRALAMDAAKTQTRTPLGDAA